MILPNIYIYIDLWNGISKVRNTKSIFFCINDCTNDIGGFIIQYNLKK